MSTSGTSPAVGGAGQDLSAPSQPLAPPPRTSSREPSASLNDPNFAQPSNTRTGQDFAGATTGGTAGALGRSAVPQQDSAVADEGGDSIGQAQKRSLAGRKREADSGAVMNEKTTAPASAPQEASSAQPKPKKKGFLSFLNCCGAPDEAQDVGSTDPAQAPKPVTKPQTGRVQQSQPRPQNASAADTSAEESKEAFDEKNIPSGQPAAPDAEPILPASETEKAPMNEPMVEKPVSDMPSSAPPIHNNRDAEAQGEVRQPIVPAGPVITGPSPNDTLLEGISPGSSPNGNPQLQVQAPTPVVPQSETEQLIHDRTPKQEATDQDIEMADADSHAPTIPLTGQEAGVVAAGVGAAGVAGLAGGAYAVSEERKDHRGDLSNPTTAPLPPPPGPPPQTEQQQADTGIDSTVPSHQTSVASEPEESRKWLLPPLRPELRGRKCLVLDLDETLVHSSFKILHQADLTLPIEIEGQYHNVYVIKRPGVDTFLKRVGELYEVVVFTASVSKYGDPLMDQLDIHHCIHHRLFRESCYNHQGNYVKDLSMIGRDLRETIIIDNSPTSYIFHPQHALPVSSWFSDAHDNELLDMIPVLEDLASPQVSDVTLVLDVAL